MFIQQALPTTLHSMQGVEGEEDSQQVSVLNKGLSKKWTGNWMSSKKSWISLKKYKRILIGTLEEKAGEIMEVLRKQVA